MLRVQFVSGESELVKHSVPELAPLFDQDPGRGAPRLQGPVRVGEEELRDPDPVSGGPAWPGLLRGWEGTEYRVLTHHCDILTLDKYINIELNYFKLY